MQLANLALHSLMAAHLEQPGPSLGCCPGVCPLSLDCAPDWGAPATTPTRPYRNSYLNICRVLLSRLWRQKCYAQFSSFWEWDQLYCINLTWKWEPSCDRTASWWHVLNTWQQQICSGLFRIWLGYSVTGVCLPAAWLSFFTSVKSRVRGMCCSLETLQELCPAFQKQPPHMWLLATVDHNSRTRRCSKKWEVAKLRASKGFFFLWFFVSLSFF